MAKKRYRKRSRRNTQVNLPALIIVGFIIVSVVFLSNYSESKVIPLSVEEQIVVNKGKVIYEQNCILCHGAVGEGHGVVPEAPALNGSEHSWHHADGDLFKVIAAGITTMPSFEETLSYDDRVSVIKYFQSWWPSQMLQSQQSSSIQNPIP